VHDRTGTLSGDVPATVSSVAAGRGGWERFKRLALIRRVSSVGAWIQCLIRFVVSIPKAIFQGDSRGMISALGDLLSRSSGPSSDSPPSGSHGGDESDPSRGPSNLSLD
jgi:hypothetical protein